MKQQDQTILSGNQTARKSSARQAEKALPSPYRIGDKWAVRVRYRGCDKHLSGFDCGADAQEAAAELRKAINTQGQPARKGPTQTTLAEALAQYGLECLPGRKGAEQESRRMNAYLRAAKLPILRIQPAPADRRSDANRWTVGLEQEGGRRIANSLREHRAQQALHRSETEKMRGILARMAADDITTAQVQGLVNIMVKDGYSASTISLERALLRQLFNCASASWNWRIDKRNPAVKLKLPRVDNARMRVLSNAEWQRIQPVLAGYGNRYAALGVGARQGSCRLSHAAFF